MSSQLELDIVRANCILAMEDANAPVTPPLTQPQTKHEKEEHRRNRFPRPHARGKCWHHQGKQYKITLRKKPVPMNTTLSPQRDEVAALQSARISKSKKGKFSEKPLDG